jgi:glycosyltransferase involved in cell wall biosynthesis
MNVIEICEFSAGVCGVWSRVKQEALELARRGHNVTVISSNIEKGSGAVTPREDKAESVKIIRFPHKTSMLDRILTKNVTYFDFESVLEKMKPDVVITHTIHPHSLKALKSCSKLGIPCLIVTHAPFNVKRGFPLSIATNLYYRFNIKPKLKKFSKVIRITNWEIPHLRKLGIGGENTIYIPNGIPDEFFKVKLKRGKGVLFFGRIAPVKSIETLAKASTIVQNNFSIVGPIEKGYERIKKLESRNFKFMPPVYDLSRKIKTIDKYEIFVLPSRREAMPQALIEAMARGKICISSRTDGGKEIIKDGKNGFLFGIRDSIELAKILQKIMNMPEKEKAEVRRQARKTAGNFKWSKIIKKLESLF